MSPRNSLEIVATLGDPSSIGPQIAAKSIESLPWEKNFRLHFIGSEKSFQNYANSKLLRSLKSEARVKFSDLNPSEEFDAGKGSEASGARSLSDLKLAVKVLREQSLPALVTGPVDKYLCSLSDPNFRGQTEYLMNLSGAPGVTMMLSGPSMRVGLVTTHLPLREVSSRLSIEKIIETAERLYSYLSVFKREVQIAICALNPHASDNGLFGDEEERIIRPAIRRLQQMNKFLVDGPIPADSLFHRASEYDGIVCMYHDQALIPIKMLDFYEAVNISLGLDFLRVSVDHGTAFDLVGSDHVSSLSYQRAIEHALAWAERSS